MNFKKLTVIAAVAATGLAAGVAQAADASITNLENTWTPFGGFDWSAGSWGWTDGFTDAAVALGATGTPQAFTVYFATYATSIQTPGGQDLNTSLLDKDGNGLFGTTIMGTTYNTYEYTALFTLTAMLHSVTPTTAEYSLSGGSFKIWYDYGGNPDGGAAVRTGVTNWTGFTDGTLLLQGNLQDENPGLIRDFYDNTTNSVGLNGNVTYTNLTYISKELTGTQVASTVQFGAAGSIFPIPTSVDGYTFDTRPVEGPEVGFQADANQYFTPEPASILLIGSALVGLGGIGRRRASAAKN